MFTHSKRSFHRQISGWLLGVLIFFGGPSLGLAQTDEPVGKVIGIIGTVEFRSGEAEPVAEAEPGEVRPAAFEVWQKVEFHQPVFAQDQFRTASKSRLKILFEDESLIALGPSTRFSVESYLVDEEDKLRQGAVHLLHGLSMYVINKKASKNRKSLFKIVTPTANIASRGTQGYISASANSTLVANQAGTILTENVDPLVSGQEELGPMTKNRIPRGQPPTEPTPLTPEEVNLIRDVILANLGGTTAPPGSEPLIEVQEGEPSEEEDQTSGVDEGFFQEFEGLAELFTEEYSEINDPFVDTQAESCTR